VPSRAFSDSTLDAIAAGTHVCRQCGGRYLEEYPHRHETPPRPDYTVMGLHPYELDCGLSTSRLRRDPDRYGTYHYRWCCYIHEARAEWQRGINIRLHVRLVPSDAVPVAVSEYSAAAAGYIVTGRVEELLDAGIGVPFHPDFAALLDDVPTELLPQKLLHFRRNVCAAKHRGYLDHANRDLCDTLLRLVICGRYSVDGAARYVGVTPERVESHLTKAFRDIWNWRAAAINELTGPRMRKEDAA